MPCERLMNAPLQPASAAMCLKLYKINHCRMQVQGKQKMTKQQHSPQAILPKRISPELAEVLHMLKSLEAQPVKVQALSASR